MLEGTTESRPEFPHKSRRKLMSPQECEIARCSPNQLEMTTSSPALASAQCPVPHHTGQLARLPLGNSRGSLRHPSEVYKNTNFSTGTQGKLHASHIVSRRELIPMILLKRKATFPQAPQEEPSLSNRYVRGTLNLLPHVSWITKLPDSKESQISSHGLNAGSSFISQDKGMSEYSVWSLEKAQVPNLIWTGGLTSLDSSRGTRSSVLQKVPSPDSS